MSRDSQAEIKIYGFHAVLAVFARQRESIVRAYLTAERVAEAGPLLKWCAAERKAYHVVTSEDLSKIAGSTHHEGIALLCKQRPVLPFLELKARLKTESGPRCLIYCDGIANPHNLGALLRTAAHFGMPYLLSTRAPGFALNASMCRVAEGGATAVELVGLANPLSDLQELKDLGYCLIGSSSHRGRSLMQADIPAKTIILLGAEGHGISRQLAELCDAHVQIPGTGQVESLNVGVAGALLLYEYQRRHPT